VIFNYS